MDLSPPREWRRREPSFSAGQACGTARRELPKSERTCRMIAMTRDLYLVISSVTTGFSAVFLSIRHIAQTRYVCALLAVLICHGVHPFRVACRPRQHCDSCLSPVCPTKPSELDGSHSISQLLATPPSRSIACSSPNPPRHQQEEFQGFCRQVVKLSKTGVSACG